MALLNDQVRQQVRERLAGMQEPVTLVVFTQGEGSALECETCADTRALVEEVAALSDKLASRCAISSPMQRWPKPTGSTRSPPSP